MDRKKICIIHNYSVVTIYNNFISNNKNRPEQSQVIPESGKCLYIFVSVVVKAYVGICLHEQDKILSSHCVCFRERLPSQVLNDLLIHYVPESCPAPRRIDIGELMAIKEMCVGQKGFHVAPWSACMKMTAVIDLTQPGRFILQME